MEKVKPILKWAGGKTQILSQLKKFVPKSYLKYIEPFLGGGALFFHLQPKVAVLADSNDELINCYQVVRDSVQLMMSILKTYKNEEDFFYKLREQDPSKLDNVERAARIIYLNKTCFNGLYRVNKRGKFNVPYGKRKNPLICDESTLRTASKILRGTKLICADYKQILHEYAHSGDFVYLDPPYDPIGGYADFKRFTKELFFEENQIELRDEFSRLYDLGCHVVLSNSNTDFVRELYDGFNYKVIDTKRIISSKVSTRSGEDIIVFASKQQSDNSIKLNQNNRKFLEHFPGTRFMGSKYSVLPFLWDHVKDLKFHSVLDAFSGSGCVSYMFKQRGYRVISNDFLHFSYHISNSIIQNSDITLDEKDIELLLRPNKSAGSFIYDMFKGLYFSDEENRFLDNLRRNIELLSNNSKKSLALAAISRACMKRRARGIFTYIGDRYDDGRRDMRIDLKQHFLENISSFNAAVFDNNEKNFAINKDIFELEVETDLVYFDPPYYTPHSDNDYTRRYHFVEGLVREWKGIEIQFETKTKKFKRYSTPFISKDTVYDAFEQLFNKFKKSILVVSYSSNSFPAKKDIVKMLKELKSNVEVYQVPHLYSFGTHGHKTDSNANRAYEYIFIAQ